MFAGKKSAQIREILISESAWEEMTCLFAPSIASKATYPNNPPTPATTSGTQHHTYKDYKFLQHRHVYAPIRPQPPHLDTVNEISPFVLYDADRAASNEVYQAFDHFHVDAMNFQLDTSAGLASLWLAKGIDICQR